MISFIDIVTKLKKITDKKRDIEIAVLLDADSAKFAQWKKRNTIPIQEITAYAIKKDIDLNYLLKDNVEFIDTNDDESSKINNNFIEAYNSLNDKKKQYFYHMVMAESFRDDG